MAGAGDAPVLLLAGFPEDVARGIAARLPELTVRSAASAAEATASAGGATIVAVDESLGGERTDALLAELGRARGDLRLVCALRERPPLARMLKLAGELRVAKILYHPLDREELAHTVAELAGIPLLPPERADDESADLAQIWSEHLPDVLARVGVIEGAIVALLEGHLTAQLADEAKREAHTLGGSVALFGFTRASSLAREIETAFRATAAQQDAPRLAQLAVDLRGELAATVSPPSAPSGVGDAAVLLLTADPELGPKLSAALNDRGLRTRICADLAEADRLARRPNLRAVIVDLTLEGGGEAALDIVRRLSVDPDARPVVALAAKDSTEHRVAVARARARAFIERSVPAAEIAQDVVSVLGEPGHRRRVLTVDDDPATVQAVQAMLEPRFEVVPLTDPLRFWDVLEETRPDVVLLDLNMPVVNGIELCRTLRLDPRWSRLPVLFLTSLTDRETVVRIFAVGADDFVAKPVGDVELAERITNRIDRIQALVRPPGLDAVTGAQSRGFFFARLAERLAAGERRAACALVALRLDGFPALRAQQGKDAADGALRRVAELLLSTFRGDDLVGRLGDDRFGILMGGFDREGAQQRIDDLRESLAAERFGGTAGDFTVTASVGIAAAPADASDPDELLRLAEQAVGQRSGTRAPMAASSAAAGPAPAAPAPEATVDVVVVDDDRALSNLLVHGLRARGYTVEWYADGALAAGALAGAQPAVRPRVLLLDVDLPGLDGHSLLRQLAGDGVLEATRVIMLTLRSNEAEVLMALQSGAFDHVAKPFSMPILIERVRRALETPR